MIESERPHYSRYRIPLNSRSIFLFLYEICISTQESYFFAYSIGTIHRRSLPKVFNEHTCVRYFSLSLSLFQISYLKFYDNRLFSRPFSITIHSSRCIQALRSLSDNFISFPCSPRRYLRVSPMSVSAFGFHLVRRTFATFHLAIFFLTESPPLLFFDPPHSSSSLTRSPVFILSVSLPAGRFARAAATRLMTIFNRASRAAILNPVLPRHISTGDRPGSPLSSESADTLHPLLRVGGLHRYRGDSIFSRSLSL